MRSTLNYILSGFEPYVQKAMREWRVPGIAVAIVKGDRLIYAKGFGVKKLGCSDPVDENTVFQVGSVTKSFTAALVSMLVEDGQITWKSKVKNHLPNFRLHDPLATREFTVEDLMSQRSGLPPHAGCLLPHLGFNRAHIMNTLRYIKPASSFRSEYAYQNNLFLAAAALIEKKTGMSWEKNLLTRILKPLGMVNSTATFNGYRSSPNAAQGHFYNWSEPLSPVTPIPWNWPHHDWIYTVAPAGGINSNILDLARWLIVHLGRGAIMGKRLVSEESINFMHTPKIDAGFGPWGEKRHYCEGWVRSEYDTYSILWHNGGTSGMKSIAAMVPEAGIGIVVLSNLYETLLPEALSRVLFDFLFGCPFRDWSRELLKIKAADANRLQDSPAPHTRPRPLALYTGTYYNCLYGPVTVAKTGCSLTITLGPKKIRSKLQQWGGDTFVLYWPGVLTNGAGVQFYSRKKGIVDTLTIEGLNDDLTGVFTRK